MVAVLRCRRGFVCELALGEPGDAVGAAVSGGLYWVRLAWLLCLPLLAIA